MSTRVIKALFANDIHRRIEEVIKVDQTDEEILRDEINEYVVTDAIRSHYTNIFDAYRFWAVGSLAGQSLDVALRAAPYIGTGLLLAAMLARPLNLLALGQALAQALGLRTSLYRVLGLLCVAILAAAATAAPSAARPSTRKSWSARVSHTPLPCACRCWRRRTPARPRAPNHRVAKNSRPKASTDGTMPAMSRMFTVPYDDADAATYEATGVFDGLNYSDHRAVRSYIYY